MDLRSFAVFHDAICAIVGQENAKPQAVDNE
jgi:hypothetical protein